MARLFAGEGEREVRAEVAAQKRALHEKWVLEGIPEDVLSAFDRVPRERFIPQEYAAQAYGDFPLPIGFGQTISQPSTVVSMLALLRVRRSDVVLEVGAGSGYNAALLSFLCRKVYTVEINRDLSLAAAGNLRSCGIRNAHVIHGDGAFGLGAHAPFERIVITAACPVVPPPLFAQLRDGGVLLAPVDSGLGQTMVRFTRKGSGFVREEFGRYAFVPLTGVYGIGDGRTM